MIGWPAAGHPRTDAALPRLPARDALAEPPSVDTVRLVDGVIDAIVTHLTCVAPERGGALLGLREPQLASLFVFDAHGDYSPTSWLISSEVGNAVASLEGDAAGLLLGTVHSHPAGVPDPSGQDERATAGLLDANAHIDRATVLILTQGPARLCDYGVLGADGEQWRISAHVMTRPDLREQSSGGRRVVGGYRWGRASIEVVEIAANLAAAEVTISWGTTTTAVLTPGKRRRARNGGRPTTAEIAAMPVLTSYASSTRLAIPVTTTSTLDGPTCGLLLIHGNYPEVGPVAIPLLSTSDGHTATPPPTPFGPWDPTAPATAQLQRLTRRLRGRRVDGATARAWPLVGDLSAKRVLLVGAGSVGSTIAEHLVRSGVGTLHILDPDLVTAANLARSSYRAHHLGQFKVDALADLLTEIDPAVTVTGTAATIADLPPMGLDALIADIDVAVLATDDMYQQATIAHRLYLAGVPHISSALYAKAEAGEVVIVLPQLDSACWNCHLGGFRSGGPRGMTDYGVSSRLVGEAGLGPSIALVSSYAALAVLAVLAGPDSAVWQGMHERVIGHRTLGMISIVPDWDWFPQVLEGSGAAGGAPQSMWLRVSRNQDCIVCGDHRHPPLDDGALEELDAILDRLERDAEAANIPIAPRAGPDDESGVPAAAGPGRDPAHANFLADRVARRGNGHARVLIPVTFWRGAHRMKENKAASLLRRKQINAAKPQRPSKTVNNRKEHDTGGKDLQGRRK